MIKSMTGFGKGQTKSSSTQIKVEIRSLNSKNLDLSFRCPNDFREREILWRKRIGEKLQRGKIDINIYREITNELKSGVNLNWLKTVMSELQSVSPEPIPHSDLLMMALRIPVQNDYSEITEKEWEAVDMAIDNAIVSLDDFRVNEGLVLQSDLEKSLSSIESGLSSIEPFEEERIKKIKIKLTRGLEEFQFDKNRFEQELIYYLEKLDINEEKVRLKFHVDHFRQSIIDGNGRRLGFISQEIGREINTLGSKSNHASMQKIVVEMKEALEKIKEQVLNIL
jgi:uncharacterized protein (TIGR00255 family)|tara:strand:- start:34550 stop:35392 length:843 start_codon:yes stop_codon:yes gene_type:complete